MDEGQSHANKREMSDYWRDERTPIPAERIKTAFFFAIQDEALIMNSFSVGLLC